jgi:hypothetical protein
LGLSLELSLGSSKLDECWVAPVPGVHFRLGADLPESLTSGPAASAGRPKGAEVPVRHPEPAFGKVARPRVETHAVLENY